MRVSNRQKLLRFLRARWKLHVILSDDSDADDIMEIGAALNASRYLIAHRPIHSGMKHSLQLSALLEQDAATFRLKTRLCQQTFLVLLGLLHSDPIFHNMSHNPQRHCASDSRHKVGVLTMEPSHRDATSLRDMPLL